MTRGKEKNVTNTSANNNVHGFTGAIFRRFSLSLSHFRAACVGVCVCMSGFKPRAVGGAAHNS